MKYCTKCGAKLEDSAKFCTECGVKCVSAEDAAETEEKTEKKKENISSGINSSEDIVGESVGGSGNIRYCPDGKYRWFYEFPLLKNPTILFTVIKVMAVAAAFPALIVFLSSLSSGFIEAVVATFELYAVCMGIIAVLSVLGYLILAAVYGGKYLVLFEMDEDGISHIQQDKQFKKAQGIAWLTVMAGGLSGNTGVMGTGMLAATKGASTTDFKNVSEVIGIRSRNTVKVNKLLDKNQVYVEPEDYDFVWNYITSRCKKAKIR